MCQGTAPRLVSGRVKGLEDGIADVGVVKGHSQRFLDPSLIEETNEIRRKE